MMPSNERNHNKHLMPPDSLPDNAKSLNSNKTAFSGKKAGVFLLFLLFPVFLLIILYEPSSLLERIKKNGELRVLSRNSPGIYYEGTFGSKGFEYDLLKRFSNSLGVELTLINRSNDKELFFSLARRTAHFAAAKLTITPERQAKYFFSLPYHEITYQLIYRSHQRRPRKLQDIDPLFLEISADDSLEKILKKRQEKWPKLHWATNPNASPEELMVLVNETLIDYTILNSDEIKINRHFYPELRIAFNIGNKQDIGWAFMPSEDTSLYDAANKFLAQQKNSGELQRLKEQHFAHIQSFDYVRTRAYHRHIKTRLPAYQPYFEKAGKDNHIDWPLLASMSYQESHWNEQAKSPTGVRGLMMLTLDTAKYLGVNNRIEPHQSIFGGAYYLSKLLKRFPEKVKQPDRTFFTLAAYNLGYHHVRDAMKLARKKGIDETKWSNLKKILPLLRQKKWYKQLKYGYARGDEAVSYVENIRIYYDILQWNIAHNDLKNAPQDRVKPLKSSPPAL